MKKLFKLALTLGAIISLTACGTEEDPSSSDTNPPASENNPAPDDGTTNNNNNNGTNNNNTNNTNLTAASMIKNLDYDTIDPVSDILGTNESNHKALRKYADDPKDEKKDDPVDPTPAPFVDWDPDLETYMTDRLGGKCIEEDDYYVWKDFVPLKGDIALTVVGLCKGFGSGIFENLNIFKSYIPEDAGFNQIIHVEPELQAGPNPTDVVNIPIDFYFDGDINEYTFYCRVDYPAMMINFTEAFHFKKESDGNYSYSHVTSGTSYQSYMPLDIIKETSERRGVYYDNNNHWYNAHNRTDEYFYIRQRMTNKLFAINLIDGSDTYASLEENNTKVVIKTAQAYDYFLFDKQDGTLDLKIQVADGSSDTGGYERYENVPSMMGMSWKPGSYYENVRVTNCPGYAKTSTHDSFFRAQKGDDGYWIVYNRDGYDIETLTKQTATGWFRADNIHRNDVNGNIQQINGLTIANSDAIDIGNFSTEYNKQMIYLSAFDGYDEIRQYNKDIVHPYCRYSINGNKTGKYQESFGDLYKNGIEVYHSPTDHSESIELNVSGQGSYQVGYGFEDNDYSNRSLYTAILTVSDSLATATSFLSDHNLTCKYGDFATFVSNGETFVSQVPSFMTTLDIHNMSSTLSRDDFYARTVELFNQFDNSEDIARVYNLS